MRRTLDYDVWLIDRLRDPTEAVAYLTAHLEKEDDCSDEEHRTILAQALINIGKAHGIYLSHAEGKNEAVKLSEQIARDAASEHARKLEVENERLKVVLADVRSELDGGQYDRYDRCSDALAILDKAGV